MASPENIIQCGQIVVRHGQIVEVTARSTDQADIDLGDCVLIPGLVNSHSHLEFSNLVQPFPAGRNFPEWIQSVVNYRRKLLAQSDAVVLGKHVRHAIDTGLSESYHNGVAVVCDIVTPPWSCASLPNSREISPILEARDSVSFPTISTTPMRRQDLLEHFSNLTALPYVMACLEYIGLEEHRASENSRWIAETESACRESSPSRLLSLDLSPHAPYSTQWSLICETIKRAKTTGKLLAMHVAESLDEREWLECGNGPFREAFERLGISSLPEQRPSIVQVIEQLGQAPRSLLIHGNYLTSDEIALLGKYRDTLSIVYCPRTHSHFQHSEYPIEKFIRAGLRVVLGTDSRASNPDLNLWQEARCAVSKHAELSPCESIRAISSGAAEALGKAHRFGSISVGSEACINIAPAPPKIVAANDFCAWLLDSTKRLTPLPTALIAILMS